MPAIAPRALARRQTRPPNRAGAICAMAAKESRPIEARPALHVGRAVIGIAEQQHDEDRASPDLEQRAGDVVAMPAAAHAGCAAGRPA